MKKPQYKISLQMAVATAICFSIIALAVVLMYQAFRGMRTEITTSTQVSARHMSNSINQSLFSTIAPARTTLQLMSRAEITFAKTFDERVSSLSLLQEMLDVNPITTAAYIGYDTGEFILLRKFEGDFTFLQKPAPAGTRYFLQSISLNTDGKLIGEFGFYDYNLQLLERRPVNDYHFDPRTRPWFKEAKFSNATIMTPPYVFFSTQEIGVSLARKNVDGSSVVGVDVTIKDLSELLGTLRITPKTEIAIIDESMKVIAYPNYKVLAIKNGKEYRIAKLNELNVPVLSELSGIGLQDDTMTLVSAKDGTNWYGISSSLTSFSNNDFRILIAIPSDELLVGAWDNLLTQGLLSLVIVIILLGFGWRLGKQIVEPLHKLTNQVHSLGEFNFSTSIGVSTSLKEVEELGGVLTKMADAISGFQKISLALNKEQDLERMLQAVLQQLLAIVRLPGGAIYLYDNHANALKVATSVGRDRLVEISLPLPEMTDEQLVSHIQSKIGITDIVTVLRNREHQLIGILCVSGTDEKVPIVQEALIEFIHKMAGSAAVAIETRQLILMQKALLDGMIKLVADAIDTKSQYTGGHCQRVPELAIMIMDKVKTADAAPFSGFSMTKEQQEEFRIAAWLHDCGKITTPEYVVDKATKLETIYNRIHEIRMRFEVLHRDATIACLEKIVDGADPEEACAVCREEQEHLQEEFFFIARCNIGGEFMKPDDIERIEKISQKTWLRYFDDRLGLSRDELLRFGDSEKSTVFPVVEPLLADRPSHVIPWGERIPPVQKDDPRNIWGFDMKVPQNMYNYGEIYNLCIRRGTLTEEERFKINDHIVQTICMLSRLPLPKHLHQVPRIAGSHHEKIDGTGYPRRIDGSKMSIPEKAMAIADIFEALTASDRPYKDGKTLSQSLSILSKMAQEQHVDADMFNLFLRSGVYMDYAQRYLRPSQIDEVAIENYLIAVGVDR